MAVTTPTVAPATARTQVLVVGAGPAGLVLACELARRLVDVRIIDQAATYPRGTRGRSLQPPTLEALDDLGILPQIRAAAMAYPPMCYYAPDGTIADVVPMFPEQEPSPPVPYPMPLLLPQWQTEDILRGRLADLGIRVESATRLDSWHSDAATVTATLTTPGGTKQVDADYLIGADGAHSTVRRQLRLGFVGSSHEHEHDHTLLADLTASAGLRRIWQHLWAEASDPAEVLWLSPLPLGDQAWQLILRSRQPLPAMWSVEDLQQQVNQRTGRTDIHLHQLDWSSVYQGANARMVTHWRVGRVLLAGDAAHVLPPDGGHAVSLAVADARNLGWKLAAVLDGAADTLLDSYQTERGPVTLAALQRSRALRRQAFDGGPGGFQRPPAATQLEVSYARGPLAMDLRPERGAVTAGDRAPDAPCHQPATGLTVRLFEVFRGPHWTLLDIGTPDPASLALMEQVNHNATPAVATWTIAPPSAATASEAGAGVGLRVLVDTHWSAHAGYHLTDNEEALVLIRPDGHIGWVGPPHAWPQLAAYFARVTGHTGLDRLGAG